MVAGLSRIVMGKRVFIVCNFARFFLNEKVSASTSYSDADMGQKYLRKFSYILQKHSKIVLYVLKGIQLYYF